MLNDAIYYKIEKDKEGWVDAKKYRPSRGDLVWLRTKTKTVSGWWTGSDWIGYRLPKDAEVLQWKRKSGEEF